MCENGDQHRSPTRLRSGWLFLPVTTLQVAPSLPTLTLKSAKSPQMKPLPGLFSEPPIRPDTQLLFGAYAQTTVKIIPPAICNCMEATLSFTGENSSTKAPSRGLSIPTLTRHLSKVHMHTISVLLDYKTKRICGLRGEKN